MLTCVARDDCLQRRHFVVQRSPLRHRVVLERGRVVEQAAATQLEYANLFDQFDAGGFGRASRASSSAAALNARAMNFCARPRMEAASTSASETIVRVSVYRHRRACQWLCPGLRTPSAGIVLVPRRLPRCRRCVARARACAAGRLRIRCDPQRPTCAVGARLGPFDRFHQTTLQLGYRLGRAALLVVLFYFFFVVPGRDSWNVVSRMEAVRRNVHRAIVPPPRAEPRDTEISGAPPRARGVQGPGSQELCFTTPVARRAHAGLRVKPRHWPGSTGG